MASLVGVDETRGRAVAVVTVIPFENELHQITSKDLVSFPGAEDDLRGWQGSCIINCGLDKSGLFFSLKQVEPGFIRRIE